MQKKGLSGVIVVVLIVLLAIVAVILVWTFTKPFLEDTLSQLELDSLSSSFIVAPGSLAFNDTNVNFLIERKSGSTDVSGFNILLEDSDGKSKSFYVEGGLAEFETKAINIDYSSSGLLAGQIVKVTLVPIFLTEDGKKIISKNPIVVSTNNFVSPPAPGSSGSSSGNSAPVGNVPEIPDYAEFVYNFTSSTSGYSNFMLSLPLNATSKRVEDLFVKNLSGGAPIIVTVVYVYRGGSSYLNAIYGKFFGWRNPDNISINDGEAFYVAVYNASGKVLNVTGTSYTSAVPIKFNKTLTMFGVPYCANNYDASDLLAEVSAIDPNCNTILKYNNSINGQFEFYSNDLTFNRSGMWSDFKILDYEGYWLMCGEYGNSNAHVPGFIWTPSCNPPATASRNQINQADYVLPNGDFLPQQDSIISLYKFNDLNNLTGALDSSQYSSTMNLASPTNSVGVVYTSSGKNGSALQFDGNSSSYATGGTVSPSQLTISLWANMQQVGASGMPIISKAINGNTGSYLLDYGNGYTRLQLYLDTGNGLSFATMSNSVSLLGNWAHIVATYNGSTSQIYVNGVPSGTPGITASGNLRIINSSTLLGEGYVGPNYKGNVDELIIWNRSLSSTEVTQLYSGYS